MSEIVLRTKALKIVNKGSGIVTKTIVESNPDPITGKPIKTHRHVQSREPMPASDYVVFNCESCGKRNRRCVYDSKGRSGVSLHFRCNGCLTENEVAPPVSGNSLSISPSESSFLVGADGRPLRR